MKQAEQEDQLPLILLIPAGGPAGEPRLARAKYQRRRKRRARTLAGNERCWRAWIESKHLSPGAEGKAELRYGGARLQPSAGRRDGHHVAEPVHDGNVAGVAGSFP